VRGWFGKGVKKEIPKCEWYLNLLNFFFKEKKNKIMFFFFSSTTRWYAEGLWAEK
jgi:hypothetical protein